MSDKERLSFEFYSVLKNEDAPPFIGDDLLVCADGLGGAGGHVHVIDYSKHPDMRGELLEAAYGDFDADMRGRLDGYLNTLVEPMADRTPDTSALWASRIVIGRFVYAMLNGEIPEDNKPEPKAEQPCECHTPCEAECDAAPASEGNGCCEPVAEESAAESCDEIDESTPAEPSAMAEETPVEITDSTEVNANVSGFFGIKKSDEKKTIRLDITDPSHREILSDFIGLGLIRVADKFSLTVDKRTGGSLLPTTLTAIRYKECGDHVVAECIWSGDSRCYALSADGMRLLSKDDEDASGAITNLFYVGGKKAVIHYRRYEIKKPCVLMTVSDGFFDPFGDEEYLGVEYTFHKCFLESDSIDSLAVRLKEEFDAIRGDDTTVAFRAFGFRDYADLKATLTPRAELIVDMANRWKTMSAAIQLADLPESEVNGYITSRTSDKYMSILPILTQLILEGKEDIVLSSALRGRVDAKRIELKREMEEARLRAERDGLDGAYAALRDNPAEAKNILKPVCPDTELTPAWRELLTQAEKIARNSESIQRSRQDLAGVEERYRSFSERLKAQSEKRYKEMRELMAVSRTNETLGRWIKLRRDEIFWGTVEYAYTHNMKFDKLIWLLKESLPINMPNELKLHKYKDPLFEDIKRNWQKKETISNQINQAQPALDEQKKRYTYLLDQVFDKIRSADNFAVFFKDDYAKRMGMISDSLSPDAVERKLGDAVKGIFLSQKNEIVADIVTALAENYSSTSVIDSMYNGTRLTRFREYYKYKSSASGEEFTSTRESLATLEDEYYSMLGDDGT